MKPRSATLFSFTPRLETSTYNLLSFCHEKENKFEVSLQSVMLCRMQLDLDSVYGLKMPLLFFTARVCEICSSTASNVVVLGDPEFSDQWSETNSAAAAAAQAPPPPAEPRRFWQGHRFLNFLLACMVFAFVISWLFHFNVPG
jgi:hypothetical protein